MLMKLQILIQSPRNDLILALYLIFFTEELWFLHCITVPLLLYLSHIVNKGDTNTLCMLSGVKEMFNVVSKTVHFEDTINLAAEEKVPL